MVLVQLCSSILDMCGGGGRPKEKKGEDDGEEEVVEVVWWEQRSSSSFLSRGWSDLTASGGLVRKIPTTERPPGSIADTCREERSDTQRQHFSAKHHEVLQGEGYSSAQRGKKMTSSSARVCIFYTLRTNLSCMFHHPPVFKTGRTRGSCLCISYGD